MNSGNRKFYSLDKGELDLEMLKEWFHLKDEEVFVDDEYIIIRKAGINRMKRALNATITLKLEHYAHRTAVVRGRIEPKKVKIDAMTLEEKNQYLEGVKEIYFDPIETFGEANPDNNKFPYYSNVAEKRCISRLVLEAYGLYDLSVRGEEEFPEMKTPESKKPDYNEKAKEAVRKAKAKRGKTAV